MENTIATSASVEDAATSEPGVTPLPATSHHAHDGFRDEKSRTPAMFNRAFVLHRRR